MKVLVQDGNALVWNVADVQKLRSHGIVGIMDGVLPDNPQQVQTQGLPMMLMKEAATILQEMGVIELVHNPDLSNTSTENLEEKFRGMMLDSDQALQVEKYYEDRKRHITKNADKILQSAKKKNDKLDPGDPKKVPDSELTKEKVINDKINQIPPPKLGSMLVRIHNECPFIKELKSEKAPWDFPSRRRDKLVYHAFKDLWERGYWLLSGLDCGVDFLLYTDDPILVHAMYGVVVVPATADDSEDGQAGLHMRDMTAVVRLNNFSKRKTLIAFVKLDGTISYTALSWEGFSFAGSTLE
ncbi:hypothetical protein HAZT_HAZT009468 [Hyalella azteca]|nr:hypothetical protein HAZT_HAZT009468 [Hyalella azteca]